MKVRTIRKFKDKNTKKIHQVGEKFTCTKKRYEEILSTGKYVEEIPKESAE